MRTNDLVFAAAAALLGSDLLSGVVAAPARIIQPIVPDDGEGASPNVGRIPFQETPTWLLGSEAAKQAGMTFADNKDWEQILDVGDFSASYVSKNEEEPTVIEELPLQPAEAAENAKGLEGWARRAVQTWEAEGEGEHALRYAGVTNIVDAKEVKVLRSICTGRWNKSEFEKGHEYAFDKSDRAFKKLMKKSTAAKQLQAEVGEGKIESLVVFGGKSVRVLFKISK